MCKELLKEDLEELEQIRDDLLYDNLEIKTAVLKVIEKQIEETKKRLLEGVK